MKPTDIRQGQTYYTVMVLPNKIGSLTVALDILRVHNRPVWSSFGQCYMLHNSKRHATGYSVVNSFALPDYNLPENTYNLHRIFRTLKQAERYAQRMRAFCLTEKERSKLEHIRKFRSFGDRDCLPSFRISDHILPMLFPTNVIAKPASIVNMFTL